MLVPRGPFLYGDEKKTATIEYDYLIEIYPVTNGQYRGFIQAGGYVNKEYWSGDGWKWKNQEKAVKPDQWSDSNWIQPDYPVIGVSYYEAEAYAKWAGKRLPTEEEWEKAARGNDGRAFPWGDEFDHEKCNSRESGNDAPTPVTKYVNGLSPYGCYDMSGNVWEWTASWYDKETRVIRGGAWLYGAWFLRSSYRVWYDPSRGDNYIGFRCVKDA